MSENSFIKKNEKIEKGEVLSLDVDRLAQGGGKGICKTDSGIVVFVSNVVPGDNVKVKLTKVKKRYAEADLVEVLKPSKHRVVPDCPVFEECGGCQWQMMTYEEQVEQKTNFLLFEFQRLGFEKTIQVVPSTKKFRYRNRIQVHQKGSEIGFKKHKSHSLVSIKDCLIAEKDLVDEFPKLRKESKERRVEIARDPRGEIHVYEGGKRPASLNLFSQVNSGQNEALIKLVLEKVKGLKPEKILDLYCGSGNLTFPVKVLHPEADIQGVELSKSSIQKAKSDTRNRKNTIKYVVSDVLKFLRAEVKSSDLVILDPPRDGAGEAVMRELVRLETKNIVYVSCDLATLVRDLKVLVQDYEINFVKGVDMFPQTYHLETVVTLTRKGL